LRLATHLKAQVYVTSGSDSKIAAAQEQGAAGGVNHGAGDWSKTLLNLIGRRPDLVVDGAGGATFNAALDIVRPGGRVVSYGATIGPVDRLEVRRVFWKQLDVLGSTMGPPHDFEAMLRLYSQGLRPIIDRIYPLSEAASAHSRMEMAQQFGKIVLRIA
jgi:NADPH:quinone reductase-like Zn-dependent oxidoreductase